jgi:hypothetical protein
MIAKDRNLLLFGGALSMFSLAFGVTFAEGGSIASGIILGSMTLYYWRLWRGDK